MADTRDTKIDRLRRWRAGETPGPWDLVAMPARTADLRQQERWLAMGLAQRATYLTKRFGSHLHRHGLRKTLRRTRAWAHGHRS